LKQLTFIQLVKKCVLFEGAPTLITFHSRAQCDFILSQLFISQLHTSSEIHSGILPFRQVTWSYEVLGNISTVTSRASEYKTTKRCSSFQRSRL